MPLNPLWVLIFPQYNADGVLYAGATHELETTGLQQLFVTHLYNNHELRDHNFFQLLIKRQQLIWLVQ